VIDSSDPGYWAIKALIALPGAYVIWRGFRSYRQRRRDPSRPQDPTTDRWWRVLFVAGGIAAGCMLAILIAPKVLVDALFVILAGAILVLFVAAAALGWRTIP
jgi:hypothetical protein